MGLVRQFVSANVALSKLLDRALPARLREDGNKYFVREFLPRTLTPGTTIYDLGGGSRPFVSREEKDQFGLTVVGLDLSAEELAQAPAGVYDRMIATDLCSFTGQGDGDAVVCQATLEHVPDTVGAMRGIATSVKPGGRIFIFAPCRNAVFARLNLVLPEAVKKKMLFMLFPKKAEGHDGFEAFYDHCTPREIEKLAAENGLEIEERRLFWISSYFMVFTPAFVLWRLWQFMNYAVIGKQSAETFAYVLRKAPAGRSES